MENKQAIRPKCASSFVLDAHVPLCNIHDYTDLSDMLCHLESRLAVQVISWSLGPCQESARELDERSILYFILFFCALLILHLLIFIIEKNAYLKTSIGSESRNYRFAERPVFTKREVMQWVVFLYPLAC